jgi:class 3 adenylate cyclase/tetratricopeptide (TPR) repeat protein
MLRHSPEKRKEGGERKQATILFADIVESTRLIAGLDAEDAMGRLRPTVAAMAESVRRFDGWIVRTLGDGLMAAFGAPRAQEGHALLACKAALAMQEAVSKLNSAPRIRVGLHSGEVVAGEFNVGSALEQETAGMTVHLASRIEQLADPGGICMSDQCKQLVRAYCDTAPLGPQSIRGYSQPVQIYRLLGLKPAVASEQFRGSELTILRGRETELKILQRALGEAERGIASVIAISAPPGVGKSRLCYEFSEWCRRQHVDVLEARALIFGYATPLQPVLEMLRSFFRVSPLDDQKDARQKMLQVLRALDASFEADMPLLSDFLGVGSPQELVGSFDSKSRHARLRAVVSRLTRSAGRRTGVIIVEDLHWLDEASGDFIETLVDAVEGTHTVLVLNFRPPYSARWMNRSYYREVSLRELRLTDIHDLLRDLVGSEPELEEICSHVADRSGGNPFFAEELIRSLAESGILVGERGLYQLGDSKLDIGLPPTLEAVIGARIDRLQEREKFFLQIGATIGKEFPLAILETVAAVPAGEMKGPLNRLCDAGLIQEQATVAGPGFGFRHPLIQEVAYAMQLRARRTRLHASVAEAIQGFEWGRLDEFAGLVAHHCEASGQPLQAAMHLQRAARWVGRTNSSEALKNWEKVRSLLRDQPHIETTDRLRALASGQILSSGWREGMLAEEAKPYAEEALRYAREVGDNMYEPMLLGSYGRILGASGAADGYVALAREALNLTSQAKDAGRTVALGGMLSQAYWLAGLLKEALAANDSALAVIAEQRNLEGDVILGLSVRQLLGFDVEHWIKCTRARILVGLGQFDEAADWIESLLRFTAGRADPAVTQFIPHVALVEIASCRDDAAAARANATRVNEYAEQTAIPYLRVAALGCAGLAKSTAGDFAGAAREFRNAIDFARHAKVGLEFEPRLLGDLADTHYRSGDAASATEIAAEAIEIARRRTHRYAECHACITRAAALISMGGGVRGEEATQLLRHAEQLLHITGAAVLQSKLEKAKSLVEMARQ